VASECKEPAIDQGRSEDGFPTGRGEEVGTYCPCGGGETEYDREVAARGRFAEGGLWEAYCCIGVVLG